MSRDLASVASNIDQMPDEQLIAGIQKGALQGAEAYALAVLKDRRQQRATAGGNQGTGTLKDKYTSPQRAMPAGGISQLAAMKAGQMAPDMQAMNTQNGSMEPFSPRSITSRETPIDQRGYAKGGIVGYNEGGIGKTAIKPRRMTAAENIVEDYNRVLAYLRSIGQAPEVGPRVPDYEPAASPYALMAGSDPRGAISLPYQDDPSVFDADRRVSQGRIVPAAAASSSVDPLQYIRSISENIDPTGSSAGGLTWSDIGDAPLPPSHPGDLAVPEYTSPALRRSRPAISEYPSALTAPEYGVGAAGIALPQTGMDEGLVLDLSDDAAAQGPKVRGGNIGQNLGRAWEGIGDFFAGQAEINDLQEQIAAEDVAMSQPVVDDFPPSPKDPIYHPAIMDQFGKMLVSPTAHSLEQLAFSDALKAEYGGRPSDLPRYARTAPGMVGTPEQDKPFSTLPQTGLDEALVPTDGSASPEQSTVRATPPGSGGGGVGGGGASPYGGIVGEYEQMIRERMDQLQSDTEQNKWLMVAKFGASLIGETTPAKALNTAAEGFLALRQQNSDEMWRLQEALMGLKLKAADAAARARAAGAKSEKPRDWSQWELDWMGGDDLDYEAERLRALLYPDPEDVLSGAVPPPPAEGSDEWNRIARLIADNRAKKKNLGVGAGIPAINPVELPAP